MVENKTGLFSIVKSIFGIKGLVWIVIPILVSLFGLRFEGIAKRHERISNTYKRYEYYMSNTRIYYYDIVGVNNNESDQKSTKLNFLFRLKNSLLNQFIETPEGNLYEFICGKDDLKFPSALYVPGVSTDLDEAGFINNQAYLYEISVNKLLQYLNFYDQLGHMMKSGDYLDESLADILFKGDFWYIGNKYFIVLTQTRLDKKFSSLKVYYLLTQFKKTKSLSAFLHNGEIQCGQSLNTEGLDLKSLLEVVYKDYVGICYLLDRWNIESFA